MSLAPAGGGSSCHNPPPSKAMEALLCCAVHTLFVRAAHEQRVHGVAKSEADENFPPHRSSNVRRKSGGGGGGGAGRRVARVWGSGRQAGGGDRGPGSLGAGSLEGCGRCSPGGRGRVVAVSFCAGCGELGRIACGRARELQTGSAPQLLQDMRTFPAARSIYRSSCWKVRVSAHLSSSSIYRCRAAGRCACPGRGRAGVHPGADPPDLARAPQDIRSFQQLDIPVYIDPTRTPNWAASIPTDFTTYVNSETESQSCVGGSVACNAAPAIYSPADAWTGPNDATFPHA